jgi:hypothetical protein
MKYVISSITPNRERGYDAHIVLVSPKWLAGEQGFGASVNGRSEAEARQLAQDWIDSQPKVKRSRRALSEGELESLEAARNERDYQ